MSRTKKTTARPDGHITEPKLCRDGLWHVTVTAELGINPATGKRRQQRHTVTADGDEKALAEAKQWLATTEAAVVKGTWRATPRDTLASFGRRWLDGDQKDLLKSSTWVSYDSLFRTYIESPPADLPNIGRTPMSELTPGQLKRLYRAMSRRLNRRGATDRKRVKSLHAVLRPLLDDAKVEKVLTKEQLDDLMSGLKQTVKRLPKARREPPFHWSLEQQRAFLHTADELKTPLRLFWWLFANTGARPGELLALRWEDVHTDECYLDITRTLHHWRGKDPEWEFTDTKTEGSEREATFYGPLVLPLYAAHKAAREAAQKARGAISPWDELVFTWKDQPVDWVDLCRREYVTICRAAGLGTTVTTLEGREQFTPLSMPYNFGRHSLAAYATQQGVPIEEVSRHLGHADTGFTLRTYVKDHKRTRKVSDTHGAALFQRVPKRATGTDK